MDQTDTLLNVPRVQRDLFIHLVVIFIALTLKFPLGYRFIEFELVLADLEFQLERVGQPEEASFDRLPVESPGDLGKVTQTVYEDLGEDIIVELVLVQMLHNLRVIPQLTDPLQKIDNQVPNKLVVRVLPQQKQLNNLVLLVLVLNEVYQLGDDGRVFK